VSGSPDPQASAAVALLTKLVAAASPNPPGDERVIAEVIREEAHALGLPAPETHSLAAERPNLIFRVGGAGPTLLLAGHTDTMPAGDLTKWRGDPWTLQISDGRAFGLGSADMKAGIVVMLLAAARLVEAPERRGSLILVLAADEENCSAFGVRWLVDQRLPVADAGIMLEPSSTTDRSWERLFVAQRGSCVCELTARGKPGHSGQVVPAAERASAAFARALGALTSAEFFPEFRHKVDATAPTVNVATMVRGGMVPFAHPEYLHATIEVRTIEAMTPDLVLDRLRQVIAQADLVDRVTIDLWPPPLDWFPPGLAVGDGRLLRATQHAWRDVLGEQPKLGVLPASTDSSVIAELGFPVIPAFGPGSLAVAHQPNESISLKDLVTGVDLLESTIRHYFSPVE
jgi:acetylornithine deacetylase/succinyl-diaminopimelate desuccinylase-like protein